ncbi:MAG: hypothetical protein IKS36_01615 [Bacteroidales bacterium]|nr:hypothetical protein [Bacteroidales bacterium]
MTNKRLLFIAISLMLFALSSCTADYYYAGSYLNKFERGKDDATERIYVSLPREVYHTNSSLNDIPGFMLMSEYEQDSVIASKTAILDKVNDDIFLSQFTSYFLYTLRQFCVPIILVQDPSELPKADDQHLVVDLAQIEIEELLEPQRADFSTRKGYYYFYDYDLRHLAVNLWLRFDASDSADVYFLSNGVDETFHGTVVSLDEGQAKMKTQFKRINVNDAYRLARELGTHCATLYVERLVTEHVRRVKGTNEWYFIYNPAGNYFDDMILYEKGIKESFIPVK